MGDMIPILVRGVELEQIYAVLDRAIRTGGYVRFAQDEGTIKVKLNENTWSPGFGSVQR